MKGVTYVTDVSFVGLCAELDLVDPGVQKLFVQISRVVMYS